MMARGTRCRTRFLQTDEPPKGHPRASCRWDEAGEAAKEAKKMNAVRRTPGQELRAVFQSLRCIGVPFFAFTFPGFIVQW
jgi:hypothetical protein